MAIQILLAKYVHLHLLLLVDVGLTLVHIVPLVQHRALQLCPILPTLSHLNIYPFQLSLIKPKI